MFLYSWPYATLGVTNNVATVSGADFKFGYVLGYCLSCETHTFSALLLHTPTSEYLLASGKTWLLKLAVFGIMERSSLVCCFILIRLVSEFQRFHQSYSCIELCHR